MKTRVCKSVLAGGALTVAMLTTSTARANWLHVFDDDAMPPTFHAIDVRELIGLPGSPTFQDDVQGGVFRMSDPVPFNQGGSYGGIGYDTEVFSGYVRVRGKVNTNGNSDDSMGLIARGDMPNSQCAYSVAVPFGSHFSYPGQLGVAKFLESGGVSWLARSAGQIPDFHRSYFLEMDVWDDPVTGFPVIAGRLF